MGDHLPFRNMEPGPRWPQNLTDFLMPNIPRMKMHHMVYHIHVCVNTCWALYYLKTAT